MEWIQSILNGDSNASQLILMTAALVAVIILVVWLFRWLAGFSGRSIRRGERPRLSVIDVATVDDKRHLVLVRRDNVEHLVMVGGGSDVLIEAGIETNSTSAQNTSEDQADLTNDEQETSPEEPKNKPMFSSRKVGAAVGGVTAGVAAATSATIDKTGEAATDAVDVVADAKDSVLSALKTTPEVQSEEPEVSIDEAKETDVTAVKEPTHTSKEFSPADIENKIAENLDNSISAEEVDAVVDNAGQASDMSPNAVENILKELSKVDK